MTKIINILLVMIMVVVVANCWKYFIYRRLDYDESYNMQVPSSLVLKGIYSSSYVPQQIYDPHITTGFPLHFLQALFFKIFGVSIFSVRLCTYIIFITFILVISYYYGLGSGLVLILMFYSSYDIRYTFISYLGEASAILLSILTLLTIKRSKRSLLTTIFAAFIFSASVHTKLVMIMILPTLLLLYKDFKNRFTFLLSFFLFYVFLYFSIYFISYLNNYGNLHNLLFSLRNNFNQQLTVITSLSKFDGEFSITKSVSNLYSLRLSVGNFVIWFINVILFPLISLRYVAYFPLWVAVVYLAGKLTPTHAYPLMFFGFYYFLFNISNISKKWLNLCLVAFGLYYSLSNFHILEQVSLLDQKIFFDQQSISLMLNKYNRNVLTNGWWQLPEISFLSGKTFYDRTRINPGDTTNMLILMKFSETSIWPIVDPVKICNKVLFCVDDYLLCEYRDQPVSLQAAPSKRSCSNFI